MLEALGAEVSSIRTMVQVPMEVFPILQDSIGVAVQKCTAPTTADTKEQVKAKVFESHRYHCNCSVRCIASAL